MYFYANLINYKVSLLNKIPTVVYFVFIWTFAIKYCSFIKSSIRVHKFSGIFFLNLILIIIFQYEYNYIL